MVGSHFMDGDCLSIIIRQIAGVQECWKEIRIQHNYIKISGKNNLTDEPVFDIAVRIRKRCNR